MHSHQLQIILLLLSFILSLFLTIAAAKYAEWARVMVSGQPSGSWLGLVFYIGSIPLLSLFFNTLHLLALHFDVLPSHLPPSSPSKSSNQSPIHCDPTLYLLALLSSAVQTLMWLSQASICTACELSPIITGAQGRVPAWCPQSKFRDTGNAKLPDMLASVAIAKDLVAWVMVPLSAALIECGRRQWMRARIAAVSAENFDPGLREYDWKTGVTVAGKRKTRLEERAFELGPVPRVEIDGMGNVKRYKEVDVKVQETGGAPSRNGGGGGGGGMGYESRVGGAALVGGRAGGGGQRGAGGMQDVPVGAPVGAGYESRLPDPTRGVVIQPAPFGYGGGGQGYESRTGPGAGAGYQSRTGPVAGAGYESRTTPRGGAGYESRTAPGGGAGAGGYYNPNQEPGRAPPVPGKPGITMTFGGPPGYESRV